jgi:Spy/CpxP family protein refolding chaperone
MNGVIERRYKILRGLYEASDANPQVMLRPDAIDQICRHENVTLEEAVKALEYLRDEGLCEQRGPRIWSISHAGVVEYEASQKPDAEDTRHFPAAIVQTINIHGGNIGAFQTGSGSTANVHQQINMQPEVADAVATLRNAASQLPEAQREEAEDALDDLVEQAKANKPKASRVRNVARTLTTLLMAYAPLIKTIVSLILPEPNKLPR